jgi:hypothetical protein
VGDRRRVVEAGADGDQRAPVVAGQGEPVMAQLVRQRDDVGGHGPLGVDVAHRLVARAVAAQVGTDDGVVGGEVRGDVPPHEVGLREAVQQHDRAARAADRDVERHVLGDGDALVVESGDGEVHVGQPARPGSAADQQRLSAAA